MISRQTLCVTATLVLILLPTTPFARTNIVITGLSTSYDYSDRQYEPVTVDPATDRGTNTSDEDYSRLAIRPLLSFVSDSQKDHFTLRAAPSIKYDLTGNQTDWDNNLFLSAERSLSKAWQVTASNAFLRSDYQDTQPEETVAADTQDSQTPTPELSSDLGRIRYSRNTLKGGAKYLYAQESLLSLGGDFIVLRNDESELDNSYTDYDRYAVHLNNEHRFNPAWKTITGLSFVRGVYESNEQATSLLSTDNLSDDLKEYHLLATVENTSFRHNTLALNYTYIGTRYDEALQDDGNIHQSRLSWRREFSQRLNTTLGAGPSYEKIEGRDATWGGNGLAQINYLLQHGSLTFAVEKRYDVDNFSGTDERGFVDYWDTRFLFNYKLTEQVSTNGRIAYRYEDREAPALLTTYHKDRITTGLGLSYSFLQYYSAGLNYTFTRQISDQIGNDYDDHRLLFTLSWQQEWLRW